MKIGIVGGIGPLSTLDYYSGIIHGYRQVAGDESYPEIVIDSVNMTGMLQLVQQENWDALVQFLLRSIENLAKAGAAFAVLASNTPHIVFEQIAKAAPIPLLSLVDETCNEAERRGYTKLILLGTGFTMKHTFYADAMRKKGIEVAVPGKAAQEKIHHIIFPNLEEGIVLPEQKAEMLCLAKDSIQREGAQALILGCTELPLIIRPEDLDTPLLNTTQIHIAAIINRMLA